VTDFGRRIGVGDMLKSAYDPNEDGIIAVGQTEADMKKSVYDTDDDGKVNDVEAHASSHQDAGTDEIDATALVGRINYVDRGDPVAADKIVGDFTTDGGWHTLDLSAIVPAGATVIHLRIRIKDDLTQTHLHLQKNGNTGATNVLIAETLVANVDHHFSGFVSCDTDRKLSYHATNTTITTLSLYVRGWFI